MKLFLSVLMSLFLWVPALQAQKDAPYPAIPEFSLTQNNGENFSLQDLRGQVYIVNFVFTRCQGPCPLLSQKMAQLQQTLPSDIKLLSLTVDPEHDTPPVLQAYAQNFGAQNGRWTFLTGEKSAVYTLILKGFLQAVQQNEPAQDISESFIHSTRFVLLNDAQILGFYDFEDPLAMQRLPKDALIAQRRVQHPVVAQLPHVNAMLNSLCALLLLWGFMAIRVGAKEVHRVLMSVAFCFSIAFLVCYLIYHYYMGSVPYPGQAAQRIYYFTILISHTVLAAFVPFLALRTLQLGWQNRIAAHRALARWTLPLWMFVSVTGVVIYWMLYRG